MVKKIETAAQCADAITALTPTKVEILIRELRAQHPNLRHMPDTTIRNMLCAFVARNN